MLLIVCGAGVNGPYGLITTAVSADLGTHETVRDSAKALGMMTAIIDGMGRAVLVSVPGFVQILIS